MPTVTVLAPDSALAMDEVIRQLGDNAYILATNARDGQVEILATNEPTQIQPPRKRVTSVSFADVIAEQVAQVATTPAQGMFKSKRAVAPAPVGTSPEPEAAPEPARSATIVRMPQARTRSAEPMPPAAAWDGPQDKDAGRFAFTGPADRPAGVSRPTAVEDTGAGLRDRGDAAHSPSPAATRAPQDPAPHPAPPIEDNLRPLLHALASQLTRLEAQTAQLPPATDRWQDPIEAAGFSPAIVKRLAPGRSHPSRDTVFVAAMARTLVAPEPLTALRATTLVVVGPSGSGKTVLAGKIAALTRETQTGRLVELASLCETPPVANAALPVYARMLSVGHRNLHPDQLSAGQIVSPNTTHVIDTNLDPDILREPLHALRAEIGRMEVAVIVALPVGSSPARIRTELSKYKEFDPVIALTKLDECELSPAEASQIAETGTQIAWLSGTRALTETMAPATEDMMNVFLTGLLAAQN